MRLILVVAIVASLGSSANADVALDITEVFGTRPAMRRSDLVIPPQPSLFVHLGSDGPRGMPRFSTADGTPIRIANVATIQRDGWNLQRVDLDVNDGRVLVRLDGNDTPVARFTIDPTFVPKTRSVALRPTGMTLWLDSDAVWFSVNGRVELFQQYDGHVHFDPGHRHRVVALYANGTEEVIYDGVPQNETASEWDCDPYPPSAAPPNDEPVPPEVLILLFLGLAAFAPFATPRVD